MHFYEHKHAALNSMSFLPCNLPVFKIIERKLYKKLVKDQQVQSIIHRQPYKKTAIQPTRLSSFF